jgi:hypothetical protein
MLGISPGLGVWSGWPFASMGLAGLDRHLSHNRPEQPRLITQFYWLAGVMGLVGACWASGSAALSYSTQWEGNMPMPVGDGVVAVAEPMALSICTGFLVIGMTAMAHRLSARACLPLALYWLSFVPFTILLFHLLLAGFELTGFS